MTGEKSQNVDSVLSFMRFQGFFPRGGR